MSLDMENKFTNDALILDIRNQITAFQLNLKSDNNANLYNINDRAEYFFKPLFSKLFGLDSLINLNDIKENFPGIDLADEKNRVAIQVTSQTTLEKIKNTASIFIRNKYYEKYDRLIVFMINEKQRSYDQSSINKIINNKFSFDLNKDIIDSNDLLKYTKKLNNEDLK